jgi:hypothetical protein
MRYFEHLDADARRELVQHFANHHLSRILTTHKYFRDYAPEEYKLRRSTSTRSSLAP